MSAKNEFMATNDTELLQFVDNLSVHAKILQFGHDLSTKEFEVLGQTNCKPIALEADEKYFHCSKNCFECPLLVNCRHGRAILGEVLNYQSACFDKVILHAKSELTLRCQYREAIKVLKPEGEIITFISDRILNSYYQQIGSSCFQSSDMVNQINKHKLVIKSLSRIKLPRKGHLMRIVVGKA